MKSPNVIILSICQALAMSVGPAVVLIGGIVGVDMAPNPSLATLPISLMIVGVALATIPASLLMRKKGRRFGFLSGAGIAVAACLMAAYSLVTDSFPLFCLSALLIGTNSAFIQQYRFAAAESVPAQQASRAVSLVLVGGIFAGFLGPELVKISGGWLESVEFAGSFVLMAGVVALAMVLLAFIKIPDVIQDAFDGAERPLKKIVLQPLYLLALLIGASAFGIMSFIMTATPIEMHSIQHFTLDQTAWVIQSHIIAMYLPSLFTGFLIARLGNVRVIYIGIGCMLACVFLGIYSQELLHYWGALVLLGIGWNFLFISGTVLLTNTYFPAERFKAQAVNDFTIFGIQAVTSLAAATVIFNSSWDVLVLLNLIALSLVIAMMILLRKQVGHPVILSPTD